jgi:hypothetical protein
MPQERKARVEAVADWGERGIALGKGAGGFAWIEAERVLT